MAKIIQPEDVLEVLYQVIDQLNSQSSHSEQIEKSKDAPLFGNKGKLDSLGLVNLIVMIEQEMEDCFEASIVLADEKALSKENSPFRTIDSLVEYIIELLE